jgi:hypothetical protein
MGPWTQPGEPGYPDDMDQEAAEAAFGEWMAWYKTGLPGQTTVSTFLSVDHLRKAFLAGFLAASQARAGS